MSDISKQFNKIFNKAEKATTTATYRALNKAVSKIKTKYSKGLQEATGLKSGTLKSRINTRKANSKSLRAFAGFGTKYGIPLSEFKPKEKNVKVGKGKKARKYKGVTVQVPNEGRQLVEKGWLWTTKSGKSLVIQQSGKAGRTHKYGTMLPRKDMVEFALKIKPGLEKEFADDFKKTFSEQLKFELKKGQ